MNFQEGSRRVQVIGKALLYTALAPLIAGLLSLPFHFPNGGLILVAIWMAAWGGGIWMAGWVLAGFGIPHGPESNQNMEHGPRSRHD